MTATTKTSDQLYERALARTPGGAHSNSRLRQPHPLYVSRADGAYLWDVDGGRWLDCQMGNGAVLLGHNHPAVTEAVTAAVNSGVGTGYETAAAVEAVELLAEIVPDCGAVRFANTGTEAVMHALAIARHATGRSRIAKAEASYHGWADPVWVSNWPTPQQYGHADRPSTVPGSAGLGPEAAETLVLPFNDCAATEKLIDAHADSLAAIIVEPVLIDIGFIPATPEYLRTLREATRRHNIVLIFDELLTGFRIALGGARQVYDVRADLTTFGKALANGYPVAAVEGDPDLLAHTDPTRGGPVGWVGTYNGHAVAMAATCASLKAMRDGGALARLDELTARLQQGAQKLAEAAGVPVVMGSGGGHFQPYFCAEAPYDYRSALATDTTRYQEFVEAGRRHRVLIAEKPLLHCALSAAHTEADVDLLLRCVSEALAAGRQS